jgi:hypothetical protein
MESQKFSEEEYRQTFTKSVDGKTGPIHRAALKRALDIRKFEIDLYWKRASYFWTFIAAALAGFVVIQASTSLNKEFPSVLLCNLGLVFSIAWLAANRGSKHWQENWENHVDLLEDSIQGPLYKVVLTRAEPKGIKELVAHLLTGPSAVSVSKVNQLLSLYVLIVWIGLLVYSLPPISPALPIHWLYAAMSMLTAILGLSLFTLGKSHRGGYWHRGTIRTSKIRNEETSESLSISAAPSTSSTPGTPSAASGDGGEGHYSI